VLHFLNYALLYTPSFKHPKNKRIEKSKKKTLEDHSKRSGQSHLELIGQWESIMHNMCLKCWSSVAAHFF